MKKQKLLKLEFNYTDRAKLVNGTVTKWPWEDNSVEEFKCSEIFQYVPQRSRVAFMEELYRVLHPEGKATLLTAYYSSSSAVADYEVEWPPITEGSFLFFQKKWRADNNITKKIKCDFNFEYGFAMPPEVASRAAEVQVEWVKTRLNAAQKLQVVLTKVKE